MAADAVRVISENPYRLARDIRGIGFRTADQIAAKLGIEKTALIRVRAGITYALAEAMNEGHCGLPGEELTALTGKLLEVAPSLIETALTLELEDGDVVADKLEGRHCVFLAGLYRAEQEIAERLQVLVSGAPPWPSIDAAKAIPWVERRTGLTAGRKPARGRPARALQQGVGDHRRPGRGQDHLGELDLEDRHREAGPRGALRSHGSGGQTAVGQHRTGGEDHPSPVGDGPADRRVPPDRGASAGM